MSNGIIPRTIHFLGHGGTGCLIAANLRRADPVIRLNFLFEPDSLGLARFSPKIVIHRWNEETSVTSDFGLDSTLGVEADPSVQSKIATLVVSRRASQTLTGIQQLKHRLDKDSTVLLVQDGIGVLEEVQKLAFPDTQDRPRFAVGIITHVTSQPKNGAMNEFNHFRFGGVPFAMVPETEPTDRDSRNEYKKNDSIQYLVKNAALGMKPLPYSMFRIIQLKRMIIESTIQPLAAILYCTYGQLRQSRHAVALMHSLLEEACNIAASLPWLQNMNVKHRFNSAALWPHIDRILKSNDKEFCSLLQRVQAGHQPDMEYFNGFLVRQGLKERLPVMTQVLVTEMVHAKLGINWQKLQDKKHTVSVEKM